MKKKNPLVCSFTTLGNLSCLVLSLTHPVRFPLSLSLHQDIAGFRIKDLDLLFLASQKLMLRGVISAMHSLFC